MPLDRSGDEIIKVLIATITAENPRYYEYYDSLDMLECPPNTKKIKKHSASPAHNRNMIIEYALKDGTFSHIFFTDDDHVFPTETISQLLSHDKNIVSGIYCMKTMPFPIVAFDRVSADGMTARFIDMRQVEPDKIHQVQAVGAGCLLVSMNVFKIVPGPWFTLGAFHKDRWGDDMYFCKLVREVGFEIYIDPLVRVGHMTKCKLTPSHNGTSWEIGYDINEGLVLSESAGE